MLLGELCAVLSVLAVIFILGRIWFHVVEGVLEKLKRLLSGKKESAPWHTLPQELEKEAQEHDRS